MDWSWAINGFSKIFGPLLGIVFGAFTAITASLSVLSGWFFESLISFTIVDFSTNFAPIINDGINTAWILFRDITNIMLIGVFVYIAFNVLLNTTVIQVEKLIVRVLVMAVLINFSLFITKVIIDISNITAIQFYEQINTSQGITTTIAQKAGVGELFQSGTNLLDTVTNSISSSVSRGWNDGVVAVTLYSLFASTLYAGLTGTFVYGSILLISRILSFFLLMITSPLAFAAWMVPGLEKHWSTWWSTLLRNAFFAPFLMLFLWATMKIIENLNTDATGIAKMVAQGQLQEGAAAGLFNTVLVVGLLYASMKIANAFSLFGTELASHIGTRTFGATLKWSGIGVGGQMLMGASSALARATVGHGAAQLQKVNRWAGRVPGLNLLASARVDQALEKIKNAGMRLGDSEAARKMAAHAGITLAPTLKPEQRVAFEKGVVEQKRDAQANKEKKEAQRTLANPKRDKEKYARMQQEHLQLYKNTLEKEAANSQKKIVEAGRAIEALNKSLRSAEASGDVESAERIRKQIKQQESTMREETAKIEQLQARIQKYKQAQRDAAAGREVDLEALYRDASGILAEGTAARRELDAIHQAQDKIREQLMAKQYFNPDAYQYPETPNVVVRAFDPTAKEARKKAVKEADYPDHYKNLGGQFKDEAVATQELVNRAIREHARKGMKYASPPESS